MPQLITAIASFAATTIGGTVAVWEAIVSISIAAGSYVASRSAAKRAMRSLSTLDGRTVTTREPTAARSIIYGQVRTGGTIVFAAASGTNNEFLNLVIALAGHEVEEIGDIYFNDELALTGAGSACSGRFAGYGDVFKKLGGDGQTAETNLQTEVGALTWTNDHRLRGIAYIYVRLKHNPDIYSAGVPNITAMVKGRKVYDPRTTSTVYSANSALCLRDFLTDTRYGLGMTAAEIDDTEVIAAANICDEDVALAAGGTENRYETHGVALSSETAAEIIDNLTGAMSGSVFYVGGKWVMRAGAHVTPTITLTEDDLRGAIEIQTKDSRRETCNRVRGTYISAANNWQPADFPPVVNATYKSEDGGEDLWRDLVLPFTTSDTAAQRIAKIELERARQDITVKLPAKLTALTCQCGDVVNLTLARYGWTAKQFEVVEAGIVIDENGQIGVDLALRETASGVWDWSTEETTVDLAPNTNLPDPYTVPTPAGLTLTSGVSVATQQPDGTILNRLKVAWTAPAASFVTNGGKVWIEYKKNADSDWITWANDIRGDQTADYITDVKVGVSYDVRIRFENVWGVRGAWSTVTGHTVTAAGITPSNPTACSKNSEGFNTATDGTVTAFLAFDIPGLPANAAKQFLVYRRSTDSNWLVAAGPLTNTSLITVTIPDLTPGVIYAVATIALSSLDIPSAYVDAQLSPFTAPSKTTAPSAPASLTVDGKVTPTRNSAGVMLIGVHLSWPAVADKDLFYYEAKVTLTNSDGATDYSYTPASGTSTAITSDLEVNLYSGTVFAGYARVRAVNSSGVAGPWVASAVNVNTVANTGVGGAAALDVGTSAGTVAAGNDSRLIATGTTAGTQAAGDDSRITGAAQKANNLSDLASASSARSNLGLGTMATQAASGVDITGGNATGISIREAGASGPRALKVIFMSTEVRNLSGGAASENWDFPLDNFGFGGKPTVGIIQCATDDNVLARYDYDNSAFVSMGDVTARFVIYSRDGTNLSSGNRRFNIFVGHY